MIFRHAPLLAALLLCSACNVESTAPKDRGTGVSSNPGAACPDGAVVLLSDFLSSLVALTSLDGTTQSASFLSTGSSETDGLSFAFSGDVALPSTRTPSGRVVLVDRFGTNVITWADPTSARVLAQLPVGTGFESNPSDYLELEDGRALVSRWGENSDPGRQPWDRGGDVLVIDSEGYRVLDSLTLPHDDDLPPRPSSLSRLDDLALVMLDRLSLDFSVTGDSELVGLDPTSLEIQFVLRFAGLKGCGRPALSPNGDYLAVACSGSLTRSGDVTNLVESALVLLDAKQRPPREIRRYAADAMTSQALQSSAVFANDDLVLLKTQTALAGADSNRWLSFDLRDESVRELLEARPDAAGKGKGIVFGAMSCSPGCSDLCLMADADRGVLQRARISPAGAELLEPVRVESAVGLPPRDLSLR